MHEKLLSGLSPVDIGLDGFDSFRPVQLEAIEQVLEGQERFQGLAVPTGGGKSLIAAAVCKLTGWRTAMLTATKGLQEQYSAVHRRHGLVDIRGKQNYQCAEYFDLQCGDGTRAGCKLRDQCSYEIEKARARNAEWVVTNYAYWLTIHDLGQGLSRLMEEAEEEGENPWDCLILDEAHQAPDELAGYLGFRIYDKELVEFVGEEEAGEKLEEDPELWRAEAGEWAVSAGMQLAHALKMTKGKGSGVKKAELEYVRKLEAFVSKVERVADKVEEGKWVIESHDGKFGRSWSFDVVWPGEYTEDYLFHGIPHVVLMSATLRPKTFGLLGVGQEEFRFTEWPRVFPPNRSPVYYLPPRREDGSAVRVTKKTEDSDLLIWGQWIDKILEARGDRKGIIHTVSYKRQKWLMEHSRFKGRLMGNTGEPESDTAAESCRQFKESKKPVVLCSPSFSTGWDFPGTECEFIVIAKVPFPPGVSKVMVARKERDRQYLNYLAMQELVQGSGRGMRSEKDRCEVFVVDGSLEWFLYSNRALAPRWFVQGVRRLREVPRAPEKLKEEPE